MHLADRICIEASYCPRSNLPIIPLSPLEVRRNTWANAFVYSLSVPTDYASQLHVLGAENANLSAPQKEALLWHQRLSHASMLWIQLLMCDRKWLPSDDNHRALHHGPFIPRKVPRSSWCGLGGLQCAVCNTAKAHIRMPGVRKCAAVPSSSEVIN